jgi:hypothetical protein
MGMPQNISVERCDEAILQKNKKNVNRQIRSNPPKLNARSISVYGDSDPRSLWWNNSTLIFAADYVENTAYRESGLLLRFGSSGQ